MGFKDAAWAYKVKGLNFTQKAVLVAYAHAADDNTHVTYIKQGKVAEDLELARSTVNVRMGELEKLGILKRMKRHDGAGQRTTDKVEINVAYVRDTNVGQTNVGETNVGKTADQCPDDTPPMSVSRTADGFNQVDQPVNQPGEGRTKRGTRIPDEFFITADMRAWAANRAPLVDVRTATEMFVNHYRAKTGRDATKVDWPATWRNWLLRDQQTAERNPRKLTPTQRAMQTLSIVGSLAETAYPQELNS